MQPQAVAASPGASAAAAAAATAAGGPAMAAAPAGVGTRHLGGLWRTSVRQEAACNTYVASISSRYLLEAVPPHERQGGEVGVDAQGWTKWSFPGLSLVRVPAACVLLPAGMRARCHCGGLLPCFWRCCVKSGSAVAPIHLSLVPLCNNLSCRS